MRTVQGQFFAEKNATKTTTKMTTATTTTNAFSKVDILPTEEFLFLLSWRLDSFRAWKSEN
jgi:hypothetical protein